MDDLDRTGRAIDRRRATALIGGFCLMPGRAVAQAAPAPIGTVETVSGDVFARLADTRRLGERSAVHLGDLVWTAGQSRATLGLDSGTRISLGARARLRIDRFVAEAGGALVLGDGAMVFDRSDSLPKVDIQVRTTYGLIGVRGTRFFAGQSRGVFGVFVERGAVVVAAAGVTRSLAAGEGTDFREPGAAPGPVRLWGADRIAEAFWTVLG